MPDAVCVPDAPWWLSPRRVGLLNARASPWRVLCRLLLDAYGAVVRGRRDECALDRTPRVPRFFGEGHLPDPSPYWHSPGGRRCAVPNGNVLTAWTPANRERGS